MASVDKFEDHCWKDVIPADDLKLYAPYARETYVGPNVAFLAIDLYDAVYRGGPGRPVDLDKQYPNSCGVFAHRAIEPTKKLIAAVRRAGLQVFYCTQETRPNNRPLGAVSTTNCPNDTNVERSEQIDGAVRSAGFKYVALDLRGFRSGSLNESVTQIEIPVL